MTMADMTEIPPGISESELEGLQQLFFEEGIERSRELLAVPDNCFDARKIGHQMHQWAGSARQLGFHHIAESAIRVELLLADVPARATDIRERLSDLLLELYALRGNRSMPIPEHLAEALRGKSVALIGFPKAEADRACTALGRMDARARLFTATDNLYAESVRECDLVVLRVGPETDRARLRAAAQSFAAGELVLAGGRRYLMALPLAIHSLVGEYLIENWEAEELLLRLALAISRKETAASVPARLKPARWWAAEGPRREISRPTVLIVDDDPIILTLLGTTLRNYGLGCEVVDNGRDALRLIREEKPHAVVLDVNMPGLDGFGVLSAIRAEELPTVVVMLSARQHEEDVLRGFQLGADDYLVKPFNPAELVARIKRLLLITAKAA
jgi:CheY-like chemotaxis protein